MVGKYIVLCPECLKQGHKKILAKVGDDARGSIFPFCKIHKNVEVRLDDKPNENKCLCAIERC